ncbi:MAG: DUF378 domain-containing protein [Rickettsiales bacterium]|nr:DUF378 domain-containing protein [Rickettsiales bacterium]
MLKKYINPISLLLIIIGGINWLLVGMFKFNLVSFLFYRFPVIENIVYIIVGVAAIYALSILKHEWEKACNCK